MLAQRSAIPSPDAVLNDTHYLPAAVFEQTDAVPRYILHPRVRGHQGAVTDARLHLTPAIVKSSWRGALRASSRSSRA